MLVSHQIELNLKFGESDSWDLKHVETCPPKLKFGTCTKGTTYYNLTY